MDEDEAKALAAAQGWIVKEDSGRGWRRVVASPTPRKIIDYQTINHLARNGFVVIGCGGGGVPVIEDGNGDLIGIDAVIDKDLASSLLARSIGADLFLVSTAVDRVALDFNTPRQRWLDRMTLSDAKRYCVEGQFDKGSMGPKIQALVEFLDAGGKWGLITNPPNIANALAGASGTHVIPG
jgi:carbamate kinase